MILSKNVFVCGTFLRKNIADAVGATSCRPVRRNGVIKFRIVVCTHKFCSHADFTEYAEAHVLRVLAMRDVGAMICAGGCRGRTLCRPVVNLRTITSTCVGTTYNLRTITPICVSTSYNLRTITPIRNYVKYKFVFTISASHATA